MKKLVQKIKDTFSILNSGKGFTLIELLVVVLIIGILGAIALPQYQLAVDKAQFAKYQALVASLRDAYDEYILIYGTGTKNFEDLSFTLPSDFQNLSSYSEWNCLSNNNMFCCMSRPSSNVTGMITCGKNDLSLIYSESFLRTDNYNINRRGLCGASKDNTRANRLCANIGTIAGTSGAYTPQGHITNGYTTYALN